MNTNTMIYHCSENALAEAIAFCQQKNYRRFSLVCDTNTSAALGERIGQLFNAQGWAVNSIILGGKEVIADERTLEETLDRSGNDPGVFLAVGSGTLTDITRYCSHKKETAFISLPTAPSVDGFASSIAPIVIKGYKQSVPCQAPMAIFADLQTLCQSPKPMIAAGFGDMLGKYTALADWRLAHIIMGESFQELIAARMEQALHACVENCDEIHRADAQGIRRLMDGLVESGICMALAGNSRPASGSEHHLSHYWEMLLLQQKRPAVLHGVKVGIGTILMARRWEQLRGLPLFEVKRRLASAHIPDAQTEKEAIAAAFPFNPEAIIAGQSVYLSMSETGFAELKESLLQNWRKITKIAASVPVSERIFTLLQDASAPLSVAEIGLGDQDEKNALRYAHYLRSQFTVSKLGRILNLWE
ncbi:MAG: sn-glycerol-1-phosphate dehydrogenase [Anaerolineales bacterium]|nr:sn-glycerol-1-phosphate dehydrogenase [Anaerolineales bacterium]